MRTLMQTYVRDRAQAIDAYVRAFDAKLTHVDYADDGTMVHCEIDVKGQVLAVGEVAEPVTGTTMQFCFQFDSPEDVARAYGELEEGATIFHAMGPCFFSPCMADIIDRFGVRWCLFV